MLRPLARPLSLTQQAYGFAMLGITCQICNKRQATTHLTEIDPADSKQRDVHLCATCIEQLGLKLDTDPPPIADILAKKKQVASVASKDETDDEAVAAALRCPGCGLAFSEFAANNRFGCAGCYDAFAERIQPMLTRYHGASIHVGRVPAQHQRGGEDPGLRRAQLDASLREAVASEAYERAAQLRDELRKLDDAT